MNSVIDEQRAYWKPLLGDVEIKPLPSFITTEIIQKMRAWRFELRYIPAIDFKTLQFLKESGTESYLVYLQEKYPKWRQLDKPFWNTCVRLEKIDFPQLTGTWLAVEVVSNPNDSSELTQILGFANRHVSWESANSAIIREKGKILADLSLDNGNVRMLEAIELSLLANREGWGTEGIYEWSNTKFYHPNISYRLVFESHLSSVAWCNTDQSGFNCWFRVALILNS